MNHKIYVHVNMDDAKDIQSLILDLMGCLNNKQFGGEGAVSDSTVFELHNRVDEILHCFSGVPLV